jgi:uncharacterized protein (TIGR02118 family)
MYLKREGSSFDFEYYLQKHLPLATARFAKCGLVDVQVMRGSAMLDGAPPSYWLIGNLVFASLREMQEAVSKHGSEVMADIPNYTNVQPLIQIGELL